MDRTTEMLSAYACRLTYEELGPEVVHQVKRTLIDTLGCAMGGFTSEPAKIARGLAAEVTSAAPARILGSRAHSSPDMAGFANGVMVRYLDCNDSYFSPGGGHPSDMIPAVLAVADPLLADGPAVITAIALAYEVFCRLSDEVVAADYGWGSGDVRRHRGGLRRRADFGAGPAAVGPRHFPGRHPAAAPGRHPHRGAVDVERVRRRRLHPGGGVRRLVGRQPE